MTTCQVQVDNTGRVWFMSDELLTEDALGDGSRRHGVLQTFIRDGDTTTLFKGPDGKPIPYGERHRYSEYVNGVSPDGKRVYFSTEASLPPEDRDVPFTADSSYDGYEVAEGKFSCSRPGRWTKASLTGSAAAGRTSTGPPTTAPTSSSSPATG